MNVIAAYEDYDDHFIYDDELYPEETLTPRTPTTPPVILDPPSRRSTQGKGLKILLPKQFRKSC